MTPSEQPFSALDRLLVLAGGLCGALGVALSPWVPLENNGSYSGALVHGFTWLALGVYLLRRK